MNVPPGNVSKILSVTCRLAMLTGALALSGNAIADYKISAYKNVPGYKQIMSSDYEAAARADRRIGVVNSKFAMTSNRCVAEVQLGDLDAALSSCNDALGQHRSYQTFLYLPDNRREEKASLLSNRGVVLALQGHMTEAEADFVRALKLDPKHANAAENLEYVRAKLVGVR